MDQETENDGHEHERDRSRYVEYGKYPEIAGGAHGDEQHDNGHQRYRPHDDLAVLPKGLGAEHSGGGPDQGNDCVVEADGPVSPG
jgi:hypothetical protein